MKARIPEKVKKLIFQEAESSCSICSENNINVLEIHHIYEQSKGGGNELENLLLVCSNCHNKITNEEISRSEVMRVKFRLINRSAGSKNGKLSQPNIIELNKSTNTGIIGNTINIKNQSKSTPKMNPPLGSIASDLIKRNYIKHLIDRFNSYKKADRNVGDFKYAIIYRAIQREFKCKWDLVPVNKFYELIEYLQSRIDNTIIGKMNKKKGIKNYSTYDEFKSFTE